MSRYDGLIIPRSYSEYINKTDAATLQQALQLSGVLSGAVAAGDNKAVTSAAVATALDVMYEDITSECAAIADTITINEVHAYRQGNHISLTFSVTTNGNNYGMVSIPQRYTPRNSDFSKQWWNYSVNNQTVTGTLNQAGQFYLLFNNVVPANISFTQTFSYFI